MEISFAQCTDKGLVREQNEDFMGNARNDHLDAELFCVADGMGGYGAGDIASKAVVKSVLQEFYNLKRLPAEHLRDVVTDIFQVAQAELSQFKISNNKAMMGTTLAVIIFYKRLVVCANIGDTRIYCLEGNHFTQKSYDHTLVNELVRSKSITTSQAQNHPKKHVLSKALTGDDETLHPHIAIEALSNQNIYLVCTDGLYNMVDDSFLSSRLKDSSIYEARDMLLQEAYRNGARDNITFQIIKADDNEVTLT